MSNQKQNDIKIGGCYRHYKGKDYVVREIVNNEANPADPLVIYQGLYFDKEFGENPVWARPISSFTEQVNDGVDRFKFVDWQLCFTSKHIKQLEKFLVPTLDKLKLRFANKQNVMNFIVDILTDFLDESDDIRHISEDQILDFMEDDFEPPTVNNEVI